MDQFAHKELAALSNTLASMPKSMPFAVPDSYFRSLEETTFGSIHHEISMDWTESADQELERISPLLANIKRERLAAHAIKEAAIIPMLPKMNTSPVHAHETSGTKWPRIFRVNSVAWLAAASMGGILLTAVLWMQRPSAVDQTLTKISTQPANIVDSFGFSYAEMTSFLIETPAFAEELKEQHSTETSKDHAAREYDLLMEPSLIAASLESIPVRELEAYMSDIPMILE